MLVIKKVSKEDPSTAFSAGFATTGVLPTNGSKAPIAGSSVYKNLVPKPAVAPTKVRVVCFITYYQESCNNFFEEHFCCYLYISPLDGSAFTGFLNCGFCPFSQSTQWKSVGREINKSGLHMQGRDSVFTSPVSAAKSSTPVSAPQHNTPKEVILKWVEVHFTAPTADYMFLKDWKDDKQQSKVEDLCRVLLNT